MGKISDVTQLTFNSHNQLCYEGKKIGKWWGKTLYYFNPKDQQLYYHNFSLIGLIFHLCCYKKNYSQSSLNAWLIFKQNQQHPIQHVQEVAQNRIQKAGPLTLAEKMRIQNDLVHAPSEEIIQWFKDGMSVNTLLYEETNNTMLLATCRFGRFEVAKYLIEHGAKINSEANGGYGFVAKTPLHHSIQLGHDNLTLYLLEHGADVNRLNSYGNSPLHMALDALNQKPDNAIHFEKFEKFEKSNPVTVIQALIKKGAYVDKLDKEGVLPLHKACEKGNLEVVKLLVNAEANRFVPYQGKTPAEVARANNFKEIANYLDALPKHEYFPKSWYQS